MEIYNYTGIIILLLFYSVSFLVVLIWSGIKRSSLSNAKLGWRLAPCARRILCQFGRLSSIRWISCVFMVIGLLLVTSCYDPSGNSDKPINVHLDGISQATLDAIKGDTGATGAQGPKGDTGPAGMNGTSGTPIYYGLFSGIPSSNQIDGELYIDTDDSHIYQWQNVAVGSSSAGYQWIQIK